jgi:hypothetical protein
MRVKFLSIVILTTGGNASATELVDVPQPWHDSHYAFCYPTLNAGMSDVYGPHYKDDEQILQFRRRIGSCNFVIASDSTSGTNSQRTVFEKRGQENWCVVLTSPPVAGLVPGPVTASTQRPMTWTSITQAPPGLAETMVIYKWDSEDQVYKPLGCYKGSIRHWTAFGCKDAYQ